MKLKINANKRGADIISQLKIFITVLAILTILGSCRNLENEISLKSECLQTLYLFVDALLDLQVTDVDDLNFGALFCEHHMVYHTRAGEAVFPFAIAYTQSREEKYLTAAKRLGNWLIEQQLPGGEWKETPEEWTGTTTDQLLMMSCVYPILHDHLSSAEQEKWKLSVEKAADYLVQMMSPEFASINYCATSAASLTMTNFVIPDDQFIKKAKELAIQVISKMNEDGFITGEGGRVRGVKYGVDLGYDLDMSLWGLGLYAKMTSDSLVNQYVQESLRNHLYFVYPDGSIDGSWGIRSNKWTTYGSKTADGCQILFTLYSADDDRYRTAAWRNLTYLRGMIKNGLIGYGPHYWELFDTPPCIYPTFTRAKNLALTIEFGEQERGRVVRLPTEEIGWVRLFPTVDVVLTRSKNFMATVSAYNYKDVEKGDKSKYMHRPSGGSMSNLWVKGHGFLQTSSQTIYRRWEPMHFPEVDSIFCLTPRIEFHDGDSYYTNLYEFDGRISVSTEGRAIAIISTSGELRDQKQFPGGVSYILKYTVFNNAIEKSIQLSYHDRKPMIRIVEPFVQQPGMSFRFIDPRNVLLQGGKRDFQLEIVKGNIQIELGQDESRYWFPFPSMKCYPVVLNIRQEQGNFKQEIIYRISVLN